MTQETQNNIESLEVQIITACSDGTVNITPEKCYKVRQLLSTALQQQKEEIGGEIDAEINKCGMLEYYKGDVMPNAYRAEGLVDILESSSLKLTSNHMKNYISEKISGILPARVIYFCFIRLWAHATCTDEGATMTPDEMNWTLAIKLWERKYGKF